MGLNMINFEEHAASEYVIRIKTSSGQIEKYRWRGTEISTWNDLRKNYQNNEDLIRKCRPILAYGYTLVLIPTDCLEDARENGLYLSKT